MRRKIHRSTCYRRRSLFRTPKILEHCPDYYSDLYNNKNVDQSLWSTLTQNITKPTDEERQSCEGHLTYGDCWRAISQMTNAKFPGRNGLTAEFCEDFFHSIEPLFITIANAQFGQPSVLTRRSGIITLLPEG